MPRYNRFRRVEFTTVSGWKRGAMNPSKMVRVGSSILDGGCGTYDDLSVFKSGSSYYVLSVNRGIPYIGLAEFNPSSNAKTVEVPDARTLAADSPKMLETHRPIGELYAQEHNVEETFGDDWADLSDVELVKKGMEYL